MSANRLTCRILIAAFVVALSKHGAQAQGTAFTYQGRLNANGNPANGSYDLQFGLYDAATNGNQVGGFLTNSAAGVSNGLFSVTLDFGANAFNGGGRWLAVGVRTTGGTDAFTVLAPLQPVAPSPYAITAGNVTGPVPAGQLAGVVPSSALSGTFGNAVSFSNPSNSFVGGFAGSGAGLTNLSAAATNIINTLIYAHSGITTNNNGTNLAGPRVALVIAGHSQNADNPCGESSPNDTAFGQVNPSWVAHLLNTCWTNRVNVSFVTNTAVGGTAGSCSNIWNNYSSLVGGPIAVAKAHADLVIFSLWSGDSDIAVLGETSVQTWERMSNIVRQAKIDGANWAVVWTVNFNYTISANMENDFRLCSYIISTNNELWDFCIPVQHFFTQTGFGGNNSPVGAPMLCDGIHLNAIGRRYAARLFDHILRYTQPHDVLMPLLDWGYGEGYISAGWPRVPIGVETWIGMRMHGYSSDGNLATHAGPDGSVNPLYLNVTNVGGTPYGGGLEIQSSGGLGRLSESDAGHLLLTQTNSASVNMDLVTPAVDIASDASVFLHGPVFIGSNMYPVMATSPGGCALWPSNGVVYLLSSKANSTAWSDTNRLSGPNVP